MTKNNTKVAETESMHFTDYALGHGFGEVHFKMDKRTGMKAIVAIHSTKHGPALGGCRFIEYPDTDAAIHDAMRLAMGMSAKAALANLPLGGGKAVIIKPATPYDREGYLKQFGAFVDSLGGRYITALDSGTQIADMDIIAEQTPYVASRSSHGDPSPSTAEGVFHGLEAAVRAKLNRSQVKGLHVAIQGLGHVGYRLATLLHQAGARLTVADVNAPLVDNAVRAFDAEVTDPATIHHIACDVFAPCALGGIINDQTIHQLQAPIIAGAANNQLAHTYHGQMLHDKGILFAPDYVINSGGLIYAHAKYSGVPDQVMQQQLQGIGHRLTEIFQRATTENKPTNAISDTLAMELLA